MIAVGCSGCIEYTVIVESSPPDVSPTENENVEPSPHPSPSPIEAVTLTPVILNTIEVIAFDIGKADAILITSEEFAVLIDTGEERHGEQIVEYLLNRGITEIDYLIITHFHKDHVGGASTIINNLTVKEVIVPDYGKESKHYERFDSAIEDNGIERTILSETMDFIIDGVCFTVYPAWQEYYAFGVNGANDDTMDEDDYENDYADEEETIPQENNFSIVVSVNHGKNNFLFTGDAKSKRLKELLSTGRIMNTRYDYLKVPHHGRYNKRSMEFIYAIAPRHAVITCSADYPADDKVVAALEMVGAEVFLTTGGNVWCESDGENLILAYQ